MSVDTIRPPNEIHGQPYFTAADLAAAKWETEYLVPGILVAKQPAILAGPRKCLKTTIAIDLTVALAFGGKFLGQFPVTRAIRVGFMSGESGLGTIQETAQRIAASKECELAALGDNLLFTEWLPRFERSEHLDCLKQWIERQKLEAVVLDPAYLCLPGDGAGNLFTMGQYLGAAANVFRETGSTMVLVHHARKTQGTSGKFNPYAPLDLEDMAWAGFQEFARQWLLLSRRQPFVPGSDEHNLWMNVGGSAGHSALWAVDADERSTDPSRARRWQVSVSTFSEVKRMETDRKEASRASKEEGRRNLDMDKIEGALLTTPNGETKNVAKSMSGLPTARFSDALQALLQAARVVPCDVPKPNNQTYPGIKLAGERHHLLAQSA